MRPCVIFNPAAKGEKATRFRQQLTALDGSCAFRLTQGPGNARALAAQAVEEGFDTIIAAGGDGTINEVLNGVADAPDGLARVRLGVLPIGTVNVFAREIALPLSVKGAWASVLLGRERRIDLPQIEYEWEGRAQRRYFIQMAGCGWDAKAIESVSWDLKKRIGQFAYMVSGLRTLRRKLPLIQAASEAGVFQGELVILGNGRFYGGQIPVFHRADHADGLLDVCVFPKINWFLLARYCLGYLSSRLYRTGREVYFQTAALQMRSDEPVSLQLEGEAVGRLPASCTIRRQALRIIVP